MRNSRGVDEVADRLEAEPVPWPEFLERFDDLWQPGEHVALIGPTGEGKTNVGAQLVSLRNYVAACDAKGGDGTLSRLEQRGFVRIASWPPPKSVYKAIENGEPARLIVGARAILDEDFVKLREAISACVRGVFAQGGWTVYLDELQVTADRRMMNLGAPIERNLIAARDRKVSLVTSWQRPANVPRSAGDQATHMVVFRTRDTDVVNRLAEMVGRPKAEVRGALSALPKFHVIAFNRDPFVPVLVTYPEFR